MHARPFLYNHAIVNAFETSARVAAVAVLRVLRDAGHTAYFAGGCVRDALLGKAPQDYDVATDAKPDRVRELFRHSRYVGEAFGVVLVSMRGDRPDATTIGDEDDHALTRDGRWLHTIEVATFRTEWGYTDGRRPTGVAFCDAEDDARRRDFTINGLFEDPLASLPESRIIDYVHGQRDLSAGLIRAIGIADERFGEDYLRLLRAVRFAARLDFRLDSATASAMRRHGPDLSRISRERIGQELAAMLTGPRAARCIRMMQRLGLDGAVLDESPKRWPLPTVVAASRLTQQQPMQFTTMLAAWLIDRHVNEQVASASEMDAFIDGALTALLSRWRKSLCMANDHRDELKQMLIALPLAMRWSSLRVAHRKRLLAQSTWPATWMLLKAMRGRPWAVAVVRVIEVEAVPLFEQGVAPVPLVTGDDLVARGIRPGPDFGKRLESLYDLQLENIAITREELLAVATTGPHKHED